MQPYHACWVRSLVLMYAWATDDGQRGPSLLMATRRGYDAIRPENATLNDYVDSYVYEHVHSNLDFCIKLGRAA